MASGAAQASQLAHELLQIHESLLGDGARNRPFYRALKASVTRKSRVLDIGSGTGLWAITAAKLGAKKVVAIEREPLLAGLIRALARDNGVAHRVEVIHGDSRQIQLAREFDVVVSETIGHLVFDEQVVEIMIDARERFLVPGGALIPDALSLWTAGANLKQPARLPVGIPGTFHRFESLARHNPLALTNKKPLRFLTPPAKLLEVDLRSVPASPPLENLTARWPEQSTESIRCFVVWVEAHLGKGIAVSTLKTPSWSTIAYRVKPFVQPRGNLEFHLALSTITNRWTAILTGGGDRETQTFSPLDAAAEFFALNAPDPDVFEKMKRLGLPPITPFPPAHDE